MAESDIMLADETVTKLTDVDGDDSIKNATMNASKGITLKTATKYVPYNIGIYPNSSFELNDTLISKITVDDNVGYYETESEGKTVDIVGNGIIKSITTNKVIGTVTVSESSSLTTLSNNGTLTTLDNSGYVGTSSTASSGETVYSNGIINSKTIYRIRNDSSSAIINYISNTGTIDTIDSSYEIGVMNLTAGDIGAIYTSSGSKIDKISNLGFINNIYNTSIYSANSSGIYAIYNGEKNKTYTSSTIPGIEYLYNYGEIDTAINVGTITTLNSSGYIGIITLGESGGEAANTITISGKIVDYIKNSETTGYIEALDNYGTIVKLVSYSTGTISSMINNGILGSEANNATLDNDDLSDDIYALTNDNGIIYGINNTGTGLITHISNSENIYVIENISDGVISSIDNSSSKQSGIETITNSGYVTNYINGNFTDTITNTGNLGTSSDSASGIVNSGTGTIYYITNGNTAYKNSTIYSIVNTGILGQKSTTSVSGGLTNNNYAYLITNSSGAEIGVESITTSGISNSGTIWHLNNKSSSTINNISNSGTISGITNNSGGIISSITSTAGQITKLTASNMSFTNNGQSVTISDDTSSLTINEGVVLGSETNSGTISVFTNSGIISSFGNTGLLQISSNSGTGIEIAKNTGRLAVDNNTGTIEIKESSSEVEIGKLEGNATESTLMVNQYKQTVTTINVYNDDDSAVDGQITIKVDADGNISLTNNTEVTSAYTTFIGTDTICQNLGKIYIGWLSGIDGWTDSGGHTSEETTDNITHGNSGSIYISTNLESINSGDAGIIDIGVNNSSIYLGKNSTGGIVYLEENNGTIGSLGGITKSSTIRYQTANTGSIYTRTNTGTICSYQNNNGTIYALANGSTDYTDSLVIIGACLPDQDGYNGSNYGKVIVGSNSGDVIIGKNSYTDSSGTTKTLTTYSGFTYGNSGSVLIDKVVSGKTVTIDGSNSGTVEAYNNSTSGIINVGISSKINNSGAINVYGLAGGSTLKVTNSNLGLVTINSNSTLTSGRGIVVNSNSGNITIGSTTARNTGKILIYAGNNSSTNSISIIGSSTSNVLKIYGYSSNAISNTENTASLTAFKNNINGTIGTFTNNNLVSGLVNSSSIYTIANNGKIGKINYIDSSDAEYGTFGLQNTESIYGLQNASGAYIYNFSNAGTVSAASNSGEITFAGNTNNITVNGTNTGTVTVASNKNNVIIAADDTSDSATPTIQYLGKWKIVESSGELTITYIAG